MFRISLVLMALLWAPSANAMTPSRDEFYERMKRATSCEKTYEISASIVSYASRLEQPSRAKSLGRLADRLEARQHDIEKQVEDSKIEALRLGLSEARFNELIATYRASAEIQAAQLIQQVDPSQYGEIIQQVDQSCSSLVRVTR